MSRGRLLVTAVLLLVAVPAFGQGRLATAKALYLKAEYEEALKVLAEAAVAEPDTPAHEAHHYRALCLLALGRTTDSEAAMTAAVEADPFFVPGASEVSPRISRLYADVRQRLLPTIVRRRLTEARERYTNGDYTQAQEGFERVTKLLADPALATRDDLSDLRLAASGLSELAKLRGTTAAAPAPAAPVAAMPPSSPAGGAGLQPDAASNTTSNTPPASGGVAPRPAISTPPSTAATAPAGPAVERTAAPATAARPPAAVPIVPPKVLSQPLPRWTPPDLATAKRAFSGAVRVRIDPNGAVIDAVIERPTHPVYDRQLLEAAKTWRYQPAMREGQPVPSETVVEVRLQPLGSK